jgi:hypothetical protein
MRAFSWGVLPSVPLSPVPLSPPYLPVPLSPGGTAFGIALIVILYLVMREGESKDKIVAKAMSPDGRRLLELHQVVAPVHGGVDDFQITIGDATTSFGDTVYSHQFECSDFKSFRIWWTDSTHANVRFGPCETGHAEDRPTAPPPPSLSWKDVTVVLDGSGEAVTQ